MTTSRTRLDHYLAGFAIWTALGLLSVAQGALTTLSYNEAVNWPQMFTLRMADWYTCAVFTPVFFVATRRWPIERANLGTRVPLHIGIILGSVVLKYAMFAPIFRWARASATPTFADMLQRSIINEMIAFGAMAGVIHAIEYYKRYREGERHALQLQARLSDAQLRALRAQLNPHFLFNTLNAVTMLLHRDPDAADAMLTRLGELLRLTLRSNPVHETTVREESELLQRYLDVMRVRFPDRVTVQCTIDPRVSDALLPSFILQPIVENAFEHGVARLQRHGEIEISARPQLGMLVLTVRDNGPGAAVNPSIGGDVEVSHGVGLENTRQRLRELYGDRGTVTLTSADSGTTVEIRLPLHEANSASA